MNFPKQVQTRSVVILLACMLVISSVSIYYAFSASTPTSSLTDLYIEPPLMEPSYIIGIYTSPSTCYLKNGTTGEITETGTFYTVLQDAITLSSTGGKIFIRSGQYSLTYGIVISGISSLYIEGEALGGVGVPGVEIDYALPSPGAMVVYGGVSRAYLGGWKNIMFRGNNTSGSSCVNIQGWISDLVFQDVGFMYCDNGVILQGASTGVGTAKIWNIWFERCLFEDNLNKGIYFTNTDEANLRMIDRVKIYQCHFFNNSNSLYVAPDAPYIYHIGFTDNTVQAERGACINVSYGGSGRQWIVSDNQIFDCGIGSNGTLAAIMVNGTGTYYPDSWLIENNVIANHFTNTPVATNNSVWLTGTVRNFAIQNNYFYVAAEGVRLSGLTLTQDPLLIIKDNVGNYNNTVTSWNMGFGADEKTASYVVYKDSSYYYMMNGTSGKIDWYSSNASQVINNARGNLTSGRTSVEKILLKGNFTIDSSIVLDNYTELAGPATIWLATGKTCPLITNLDRTVEGNTQVIVRDLKLYGRYGDYSHIGNSIDFYNFVGFTGPVMDYTIENVQIENSNARAISLENARVSLKSVFIYGTDTDGIYAGNVYDSWFDNIGSANINRYNLWFSGGSSKFVSNIYLGGLTAYAQINIVSETLNKFSNIVIDQSTHEAIILNNSYNNQFSSIGLTRTGTATTNTYDAILVLNSQNNTMNNVNIRRSVSGENIPRYGINETGTSDFNIYSDINAYDTGSGNLIGGIHSTIINSFSGSAYVLSNTQSASAQLSCVNGTEIAHGLSGAPTSITLTMYGQNFINSTCWYLPPTVYSVNATHIVVCFSIFNAGTITAVAAPNSRTIYWIAVYKP